MLDIVSVLGVMALFALVALVGRAVDRLGPRPEDAPPRAAARGGQRG